jgi:hypothetical protein
VVAGCAGGGEPSARLALYYIDKRKGWRGGYAAIGSEILNLLYGREIRAGARTRMALGAFWRFGGNKRDVLGSEYRF